jgi:predicted nucleic acid-binding protein
MIVVDTSTIIKGFFSNYPEPKFIVDRIADGTFKLAMSEEMAKELAVATVVVAVNNNHNPAPYVRNIAQFIYHTHRISTTTTFTSCYDPDDNMFFECAIDTPNCKNVISSDRSIFTIKNYITDQNEKNLINNINFYNPQQFYNLYTQQRISI